MPHSSAFPLLRSILYFLLGCWAIVIGLSLFTELSVFSLRVTVVLWAVGWGVWQKEAWIKKFRSIRLRPIHWLMATFFTVLFVQGLFSAPNTTDTMTYHLPRVMFWFSEGTVFPSTTYTINDFLSPFGDYLLMILYGVGEGDRWLFLLQWLSAIGCVWVVGILAELLFPKAQLANQSRLWAVVLPTLALQSVSTQIELFVSFLVLAVTCLIVKAMHNPEMQDWWILAPTLALALLTKATVVFFIPIWLLYWCVHRKNLDPSKVPYRIISASCTLALLMVSVFALQNLRLYGTIQGKMLLTEGIEYHLTNDRLSAPILVSNLVRNLFVHLPVPILAPSAQETIETLHARLGQPLNDPAATWMGTEFQVSSVVYPQEDLVSNPLHFGLFLLLTVLLFLHWKKTSTSLRWLLISGWLFFFSFSLVLKWQPWHSRLHLPIFFLISILIAKWLQDKQRLNRLLLGLSAILSICLIGLNVSRPFIDYTWIAPLARGFVTQHRSLPTPFYSTARSQQYFLARPEWFAPTQSMLSEIPTSTKFSSVCFDIIDGFEYPFWAVLKPNFNPDVRTSHDCANGNAELHWVTTREAQPYLLAGFQCEDTTDQEKFVCIKY